MTGSGTSGPGDGTWHDSAGAEQDPRGGKHQVSQVPPWPPSPDSEDTFSRWSCRCGWLGPVFRDTRNPRWLKDFHTRALEHQQTGNVLGASIMNDMSPFCPDCATQMDAVGIEAGATGRFLCRTCDEPDANNTPDSPETLEMLTVAELRAMELTVDLWNLIAREIVGSGPSREGDLAEIAEDVHGIQARIMAQAAARAYPSKFRLLGWVVETEGKSDDY